MLSNKINQSFVIHLSCWLQRILSFYPYPFSLTPFPCKRNNFIYFFLFQFSHLILSNHLFYGTSLFASILSHTSTMRVCGVGEGMSLFYIHSFAHCKDHLDSFPCEHNHFLIFLPTA